MPDENIKPLGGKEQKKRWLTVSETFVSIQGETSWAGWPCFFIRLAGCNLNCVYCDTKYARSGGKQISISSLVEEFKRTELPLVMVTGGEPLVQANTVPLVNELLNTGTVLVETNGSHDISVLPAAAKIILDIKCPSSGENLAMDWNNIQRLRSQDEVKFVIANYDDYLWACQFVWDQRLTEKCQTVLFGVVHQQLSPADLSAWILCDRLKVRLNLQLHKIIWPGMERGV